MFRFTKSPTIRRANLSTLYKRQATTLSKLSLFKLSEQSQTFDCAPRVLQQLADTRLGELRGKLDQTTLNKLLQQPDANVYYDTKSHHINVIQTLDKARLRITVLSKQFTVISVGPIRSKDIENSLKNGRFRLIQQGDFIACKKEVLAAMPASHPDAPGY